MVSIIKKYPNVAVTAIIEPGALPLVVANLTGKPNCQLTVDNIREGVVYALKALNIPNVAIYLDAAHNGLLGWRELISRSSGRVLLV